MRKQVLSYPTLSDDGNLPSSDGVGERWYIVARHFKSGESTRLACGRWRLAIGEVPASQTLQRAAAIDTRAA